MALTWLVSCVALWAEPSSERLERGVGALIASVLLTGVLALLLLFGCIRLGMFVARRAAAEKGKQPSAGGWIVGTLAGLGLVAVSVPYLFMFSLFVAVAVTQALYP